VFAQVLPLVDCFVKHLLCHRQLAERVLAVKPQSPFWQLTSDAHIQQAAIYWCMVFGAWSNATHWRNLSTTDTDGLRQSFRDGLLNELGVSLPAWEAYQQDVKSFRDTYAAHREGAYEGAVPSFDLALEVAFFFDSWVRDVIAPDILDEQPLRTLAAEFDGRVQGVVTSAVG
jgi:hypothetical protein